MAILKESGILTCSLRTQGKATKRESTLIALTLPTSYKTGSKQLLHYIRIYLLAIWLHLAEHSNVLVKNILSPYARSMPTITHSQTNYHNW